MAAELTEKQEAFCREYIKDLNATQAATRAGYSEDTATEQGSRLLTNVKVQNFLAELKSDRNERLQIDADWVLNQAVKVHLRCMQSAPVLDKQGNHVMIEDANGELVPAYTFEHAGANKSLELIGKHVNVGAFKESINLNLSSDVTPWSSITSETDE